MASKNPLSQGAKASAALQIFKPGTHLAMSGQALAFSEADLQATVAAYDPTLHEAPLVVGHPVHDMPAYGWVQSLQFSDGGIDATPAQVNNDFADMVAAGAFKKISASFYSPSSPANPVPGVYYLRHVGFLGAAAPAVKGMRNPSFADTEEGVVTFSEWDDATNPSPSFSEVKPKEPTVTPEEKAALEAENTRLRAELASNKATQIHAAHLAFCEGLKGLPLAARGVVVATLDHLALDAAVDFGEGDGKAPLLDALKAVFTALPAPVQLGENATKSRAATDDGGASFAAPQGYRVDAADLARHHKALAHVKTHGGTYMDAALAVA